MLLEKAMLNTLEVLIVKTLIDSYISHDEFFSVNNVLREYNEIKEEIKNPEFLWNKLYKYGWYKEKSVSKKWCRNNSR